MGDRSEAIIDGGEGHPWRGVYLELEVAWRKAGKATRVACRVGGSKAEPGGAGWAVRT